MSDRAPPPERSGVTFDKRITLGNLLTIASGICVCVGWVVAFTWYQAGISAQITGVETDVRRLECSMAQAGFIATIVQCTFKKAER